MVLAERALTPQEQRIADGKNEALTTAEARIKRPRIDRMLTGLRSTPPRLCVQPALLYTESFMKTEGLPLIIRVAMALENVMSKVNISIGDDELIVGHCGVPGRHGVMYPHIRGQWFENRIREAQERKVGNFTLTEEDKAAINERILPYWKGKTVHEAYINLLPEETRRLFYGRDIYTTRGVIDDKGTLRAYGEWISDFQKVLTKGFNGIKREAEQRLASLDVFDSENSLDKMPFLKAVIIICDAIVTFARRYAELARTMAQAETNEQRKGELLEIAEVCEQVPGNPARTFREALQSQWFTRVGLTFEDDTSAEGSGRMDQSLYSCYKRDKEERRITDDDVLELLECHWLKQAQFMPLFFLGLTPAGHISQESYAHWETVTVGGQTSEGKDATNELSYLILQSKMEFPLNYPDLMVRVHSRSPQAFLMKACECVKEGTGFPKFLNDEEIVPSLMTQGATWKQALDYSGSGCAEVKVVNKDAAHSIPASLSLPSAVDMALNDGAVRLTGERLGLTTGDPRRFAAFNDVMDAFKAQVENLLKHCFVKQTICDMVRSEKLATPLHTCLHDLCTEQCQDLISGKLQGAIYSEGNIVVCGFGTTVDSLAAVKKLIFDDKSVSMSELVEALDTNFEGKEALRQMCLHAPKYGNNDSYADSIGREVERILVSYSRRYTNMYGGKVQIIYVPAAAHVMYGGMLGATPNGRRAGEPLSDGISPSQGCDLKGPTAILLSLASIRDSSNNDRQSRLLNVKFSPKAVAGEAGTRNLVAFLRTWCDLKLWHVQFNIVNSETLRDAQRYPEKYRNLLVRVAGYSAYFVDLTPELQDDIIKRTEHEYVY